MTTDNEHQERSDENFTSYLAPLYLSSTIYADNYGMVSLMWTDDMFLAESAIELLSEAVLSAQDVSVSGFGQIKQKRERYLPWQLNILETTFNNNLPGAYLSTEAYEDIATQTNKSVKQVKRWFSAKRFKEGHVVTKGEIF